MRFLQEYIRNLEIKVYIFKYIKNRLRWWYIEILFFAGALLRAPVIREKCYWTLDGRVGWKYNLQTLILPVIFLLQGFCKLTPSHNSYFEMSKHCRFSFCIPTNGFKLKREIKILFCKFFSSTFDLIPQDAKNSHISPSKSPVKLRLEKNYL